MVLLPTLLDCMVHHGFLNIFAIVMESVAALWSVVQAFFHSDDGYREVLHGNACEDVGRV